MKRALKIFSVLTTIGMFLVLMAGTLVTNTGSQDGCGNTWPLCHGEFRPMATLASMIEYSHRAITGIVGIMVGILAVWMWRTYRQRRDVKWLSFLSIFFIFVQAVLGAAAVIWKQSEAVLALHFGISLIAFASVLLLCVITFEGNHSIRGASYRISKGYRNFIWGIFVYVYGLIYLGAYVRRVNAGMAIETWPLNNGRVIPDHLVGEVAVSFTHRLAALVGLLLFVTLLIVTKRRYPERRDFVIGSVLCVITLILQIFSGGYLVLSKLSVDSLMLHNTFVSLFFASLSYLCYQVATQTRPGGSASFLMDRDLALSYRHERKAD
ncbi:COX15/CtaA family protein [Effusibacillus dendaii]|uniref:Heme A synthase n=1 Tax=Effusibacillus dendaii TaxID=2743772 RepID=A0A7I8DA62_9BACL|nr:heme A synthase [Effusibacillus dendaii]BCJ87068.1 heme A synthase [Effusibacillus dendaii]